MPQTPDTTDLLVAWSAGDPAANDGLMEVFRELRGPA